jgi:hypothetical protein
MLNATTAKSARAGLAAVKPNAKRPTAKANRFIIRLPPP